MFQIDEKLANAILNYLATRPYAEVFQMVELMRQLKKIDGPEKTEKTDN